MTSRSSQNTCLLRNTSTPETLRDARFTGKSANTAFQREKYRPDTLDPRQKARSFDSVKKWQNPLSKVQTNTPASTEVTDEMLAHLYKETHDQAALCKLISKYEKELTAYLRRYTGDAEIAEDVMQATWLKVHLGIEKFEEGKKFRPWLYTIATNSATDEHRRVKRHQHPSIDIGNGTDADSNEGGSAKLKDLLLSKGPSPEDRAMQREASKSLSEALDTLNKPLREAIDLVYFQRLKYNEAAIILKIPIGTVKSRLHSAILALHDSPYLDFLKAAEEKKQLTGAANATHTKIKNTLPYG